MNTFTDLRKPIARMENLSSKSDLTDAEAGELLTLNYGAENTLAWNSIGASKMAAEYGITRAAELPEYETLQLMEDCAWKLSGRFVEIVVSETPPGELAYTCKSLDDSNGVKMVIAPRAFDDWGVLLHTFLHETAHARSHYDYMQSDLTEAQKARKDAGDLEGEAEVQARWWENYARYAAPGYAVNADTLPEAHYKAMLLALIQKDND